jgi:anti-sigma regulatory factor (Ser/Thr protein kinase)
MRRDVVRLLAAAAGLATVERPVGIVSGDAMTLVAHAGVSVVPYAGADGATLLRALADEPRAVIYDVDGVSDHTAHLLATFDVLDHYLAGWPATPVLVRVTDDTVRQVLRFHRVSERVTSWRAMNAAMSAGRRLPEVPRAVLELECSPKAARTARDFVRRSPLLPADETLADTAILLVSELVTNAVQNAGTPITVTLSSSVPAAGQGRAAVRIAVRDGGEGRPVLLSTAADMEHGRGLFHVDSLSRNWGIIPLEQGKAVWAVVDGTDRPMSW